MENSNLKGPSVNSDPEEEITNNLNRIKTLEKEHEYEDEIDYKQRQLRFNKWLTILTGLLVLTSLIADYISITALDAAKKSADAAAAGALVAQQGLELSRESIQKTLAEMETQSKASQMAAEASKAQADISKKAAEFAEHALQVTEAADMTVQQIACSTVPNPLNANTEIVVVYKNTGRTRAENVQVGTFVGDPEKVDFVQTLEKGVSVSSISPGATGTSPPVSIARAYKIKAPDVFLSAVNSGTVKIHLWGWVTYDDVFSRKHRMEFDTIYEPNTQCEFRTTKASSY